MYGENQDRDLYLGAGPLVLGAATGLLKGIGSLFGGGVDADKYKKRTTLVNTLTVRADAGDLDAIQQLETIAQGRGTDGTGDKWGTAYAKIVKAAGTAAAAARARLGQPAGGGTTPNGVPYVTSVGSALGVGSVSPLLLAGAAAGAFLLLRRRGRR